MAKSANNQSNKDQAKRVNVDEIKANLLRPSLTSYFAVEIPLPNSGKLNDQLKKVLGQDQRKLNLLCTDSSLPGSRLTTMDINNDRTGVTEKHAYRRMFDDSVDFTFYVDADKYLPILFFETWMKGIMNESDDPFSGGIGPVVNTKSSPKSKQYHYKASYPDTYMADQGLKILKFERDYKSVLTYEFYRAFPLSVASMPVSYSGNDLLKCTVSMSYIRYIQTGPTALDDAFDGSGLFGGSNSILNSAANFLKAGADDLLKSAFNIT